MSSTLAHPRTGSRVLAVLSLLAALALVVSACGSSTDTTADTTADTETDTTDTGAEPDSAATDTGEGTDTTADGDSATDNAGEEDAAADDADNASTGDDGAGGGTVTDFATIGELLEARGVDAAVVASRFEGTLEMTGSPGSDMPESFSMTFTGVQDPENQASEVSVDFGEFLAALAEAEGGSTEQEMAMMSAIFEEPLRTITIGDTAYVQWALLTMFAGGAGDEWVETDLDGAGDITAEFGAAAFGSSNEALGPFVDANADIAEIGNETIRGIDTVHYRADVRIKEYYESLSDEEKVAFDEQFDTSSMEFDTVLVELWIDDDGHIVRINYSVSDPAMFDQAEGIESVDITIETYDFGADIEISPPPADKILSEEELGFDPGA